MISSSSTSSFSSSSSSSSSSRFNYQQPLTDFEKKKKSLQELTEMRMKPKKNKDDDLRIFLKNLLKLFLTISVVFIAILYAWFANYPEPPLSPILFQWKEMGKQFQYNGFNVFYFDKINDNITDNQNKNNDSLTLLYLHGFPTSSYDLYKLVKPLSKKFSRIIAPDFLGFGFSDKPRSYSYSINDQANLIKNLVKSIGLENVHILSHDYGDSVAQELIASLKENSLEFKILSVCMMNGGIFPSHHHPILMQKLLRSPIIGTIVSKFSNYLLFSLSFSKIFGPNTQPSQLELYNVWKLIRINDGYQIFGNLLSYIDDRKENEDRWVDSIRNCPIPLHFIYGPFDPINKSPEFNEYYLKIINNPSLEILPDSIGHYPQLEAPELVIDSYFKFLKNKNFI